MSLRITQLGLTIILTMNTPTWTSISQLTQNFKKHSKRFVRKDLEKVFESFVSTGGLGNDATPRFMYIDVMGYVDHYLNNLSLVDLRHTLTKIEF